MKGRKKICIWWRKTALFEDRQRKQMDIFFKDEKRYKFQMQNNSSMKGTAEIKIFFSKGEKSTKKKWWKMQGQKRYMKNIDLLWSKWLYNKMLR